MPLFCFTDRNLNPKAACLKRREEEKALRLTTSAMSDALTTSLMESNLPSSLQAQSIFYPGTNSPPLTGGRSSTPLILFCLHLTQDHFHILHHLHQR